MSSLLLKHINARVLFVKHAHPHTGLNTRLPLAQTLPQLSNTIKHGMNNLINLFFICEDFEFSKTKKGNDLFIKYIYDYYWVRGFQVCLRF